MSTFLPLLIVFLFFYMRLSACMLPLAQVTTKVLKSTWQQCRGRAHWQEGRLRLCTDGAMEQVSLILGMEQGGATVQGPL